MLHPVRARVELRRVCLALDSSANRWVVPLPGASEDEEGVEGELDVRRGVSPWFSLSDSQVPAFGTRGARVRSSRPATYPV